MLGLVSAIMLSRLGATLPTQQRDTISLLTPAVGDIAMYIQGLWVLLNPKTVTADELILGDGVRGSDGVGVTVGINLPQKVTAL